MNDVEIKPDQRPYQAYGAARQLWSCRDEEILIEGPAGTGKTRAILEKLHFCAMKYAGMRGLMIRKTRESLTETVLVTFEEKVVQPSCQILLGPRRNLRQVYRYPNGSQIVIGGMDKPMKVMSSEYDMITTYETTELTEEDFENLTTRLRNGMMPYQQIVADCNPGSPHHWLNKRPDKTGMTRLLSRHQDNPVYFNHKSGNWTDLGERYLRKLARLSGARRLRLFMGKWAMAEGVVYDQYDEQVHVIPRFNIPPNWRRIRSIDFGYKNPFVCQWWAIDHDDRMFLYRELYRTKRTVPEHAATIMRLSEGERYEITVADHDAEDRAVLEMHGIYTAPAYKAISPGIQAVQDRLAVDHVTHKPRLFILRDSLVEPDPELLETALPICTQKEFDGYMWHIGIDGKPVKEEPVDKDNHGMDTMRYAVGYVDRLDGMLLRVSGAEAVSIERCA